MLFSSLLFLYLFLPCTLFFVFFGRQKFANTVLFAASLVFCAWGGVSYTSILIISILINYFTGKWIEKGKTPGSSKWFFIFGIILNLGLLIVFKYTNFFLGNLNLLFDATGIHLLIPVKKILLPLGVSFYTFKAISYLFSVYRKEMPAERNFINLALYISLFPELAAGPIDRYKDIRPQIIAREVTFEKFFSGIRRFAIGFAKKVIISSPLAYAANQVFSLHQNELDTPVAWIGIVCYTLQIYFDFSGYTDMAIGVGRMFGFTFVENFNFPYISRSVREFWKRWHMSLSSWFRDYLFLPLAYSYSRKMQKDRYGWFRTDWIIYALATMITFLLCGFWHGAAWNFVVWGGIHGIFLILEQTRMGKKFRKSWKPIQHLYFLLFLVISWVFFRSASLPEAFGFIGVLFGGGIQTDWIRIQDLLNYQLISAGLIAILACTPVFKLITESLPLKAHNLPAVAGRIVFHVIRVTEMVLIIIVIVAGTIMQATVTTNPFLYFKF